MTFIAIIGLIVTVGMAYFAGLRDGQRTFQIELRQALHRGEDVIELIEAPGGPSDYA